MFKVELIQTVPICSIPLALSLSVSDASTTILTISTPAVTSIVCLDGTLRPEHFHVQTNFICPSFNKASLEVLSLSLVSRYTTIFSHKYDVYSTYDDIMDYADKGE